MNRGIGLVLLLAAVLSGCGDRESGDRESGAEPPPPAASPTAMLPADGPVRAIATVLDEGAGPVLCLGGVMTSLPPQCDGPAVAAWSWDERPHETAGGVKWGDYTMVGVWDGTTFTPAEVRETTPEDWPEDDTRALFASRCEEPDGGWTPVDPATTTGETLASAHEVAARLPDYALSWGDQTINPRWDEAQDLDGGGESALEVERAMNDPRYTVLNVAVTDDLARAEQAVREVWGGALCVTRFANTEDRLREVADALGDLPGGLGRGYGTISNTVEISVVHDDGSIQAWADEEFGAGVVTVTSALRRVEK